MSDSHLTQLRDGRDLAWLEVGDPSGEPVVAFHGTPGSRRMVQASGDDASAAGVRLICPDRPGYGMSTLSASRRLVDWPDDVAQLADRLDIERFFVLGVSGGGPHATACAALLADRVRAAAIVSGVAPLTLPGATEEMTRLNRFLAALSARRSPIVRWLLAGQLAVARRRPAFAMDIFMRQLPPADVAVLERPEVRSIFDLEVTRGPRSAARAAAQDLEIFSANWGFSLADVAVPVDIWQGDVDTIVPARHAELLRDAIPGSTLHEMPGEGHFMVLDHVKDILDSLVSH